MMEISLFFYVKIYYLKLWFHKIYIWIYVQKSAIENQT